MIRVYRCSQASVYWLPFGEGAIPGTSSRSMFHSSDHHDLPPEIIDDANFPADPCEDFFQFVCGKWIGRVGEPKTSITHFNAMWKLFRKQEQVMLQAEELRDSRAMASAQRFYHKCLTRDDERKSKGGAIAYVMQIIRVKAEISITYQHVHKVTS
ncbi:hypothetical protein Y032_0024g1036 [Ancylostoma ceylanicum]|nr:hypothetical protein Y032_0024g1036 [Ancylostoma ceylanicum]